MVGQTKAVLKKKKLEKSRNQWDIVDKYIKHYEKPTNKEMEEIMKERENKNAKDEEERLNAVTGPFRPSRKFSNSYDNCLLYTSPSPRD